VVLISSSKKTSHLSFKLDFKVTNNIAEYEALLLGLMQPKRWILKDCRYSEMLI
jgi:ribonuclease HI